MEFAEGSWARSMVSIVFKKECVLTQNNKAYRDGVLSSPPNTIGCKDSLSVRFHTKKALSSFTWTPHHKDCSLYFCDLLRFTASSAFLRVTRGGCSPRSRYWFPVSEERCMIITGDSSKYNFIECGSESPLLLHSPPRHHHDGYIHMRWAHTLIQYTQEHIRVGTV